MGLIRSEGRMKMFSFQKLTVWQKSIDLIDEIDEILNYNKMPGEFELRDQLRRAVLSISTNVAEGIGRENTGEKKHFLGYAKGSVFETVSLMFVIRRKNYCSEETYNSIYNLCDEIAAMLYSMIKSKDFI